jgi:hypothetical protein
MMPIQTMNINGLTLMEMDILTTLRILETPTRMAVLIDFQTIQLSGLISTLMVMVITSRTHLGLELGLLIGLEF